MSSVPSQSRWPSWRILVLSPYATRLLPALISFGDEVLVNTGARTRVSRSYLTECECDFIVSFGYLRILSAEILDAVSAVNVHPGLLPDDRGPNPHLWSTLRGSRRGATIHYVDRGIDTGDIIAQRELRRADDATRYNDAYEELVTCAAELFHDTWPAIRQGVNTRVCQGDKGSSHTLHDQQPLYQLLADNSMTIGDFRRKALHALAGEAAKTNEQGFH